MSHRFEAEKAAGLGTGLRRAGIVASGLFVAAGSLLFSSGHAVQSSASRTAMAPAAVQSFDSSAPDTWTRTGAAPALPPSTLAIPDLGLWMHVTDIGVDARGYLDMPESSQAAHFVASAPLGSYHGSIFVAGHANWPDGSSAPMGSLIRLTKGMPVYVADTAGTVQRYRADTLGPLPKTALPSELISLSGPARVVLVTCDLSSSFRLVAGTNQYADNIVATATLWP